MIEIIGVPFDLCGVRHGSRLGPAAVRLANLQTALQKLGLEVHDFGDVESPAACGDGGSIKHFAPAHAMLDEVSGLVAQTLERGDLPLVIGGDHSISIGTVGAALGEYGQNLAVLWIDAHADLNTPTASPSGNLHGMPLAALLGQHEANEAHGREWKQIVPPEPLEWNRAAWFGLREIDDGEALLLRKATPSYVGTMYDIDRHGVYESLRRFDSWLRRTGASKLWISFDVDVLDPILAPGTGTAVRGGLTYREAHLVAEILREFLDAADCPYHLVGLDLVEINPLFDTNNETAKTAVEWIASLFGKTILGTR